MNWEIGIDIYTPLYIKWIIWTYSIAQGTLFCNDLVEKESKKSEYMYTYN